MRMRMQGVHVDARRGACKPSHWPHSEDVDACMRRKVLLGFEEAFVLGDLIELLRGFEHRHVERHDLCERELVLV